MHAKPDLRVVLKWKIAGSGSVIADVIPLVVKQNPYNYYGKPLSDAGQHSKRLTVMTILCALLLLASFAGTMLVETVALVLTRFGRQDVPGSYHTPLIVGWLFAAAIGIGSFVTSCTLKGQRKHWTMAASAIWCCYHLYHGILFCFSGSFGYLEQ